MPTDLPVGWGIRTNGVDPALSVKAERPGDWRESDMKSKYNRMDDLSSASEGNQELPFGFEKRDNSKTLEELSLSSNATNVAVAEVTLKDVRDRNGGELSYIKPVEIENLMKSATPAHVPALTFKNSNPDHVGDPTIMMLAKVVVQMDSRMKEMERNMEIMIQKQDLVLQKLSKIS